MILRQVVCVAARLEPAAEALCAVLGLRVAFRDPGVARFGLENGVVPADGTFIEIVAPTREGTAAGRYLARRGGDGPYMVILQTDDALAARARIAAQGVRVVEKIARPAYVATHFHPADTGGVLLSIDHVPGGDRRDPRCPWPPAGADWETAIRTETVGAVTGVDLQSDDPPAQAALWSRLLEQRLSDDPDGAPALALENARLRFVPATDGRGVGIAAYELAACDLPRILAAARARGLAHSHDTVELCGTRFRLRSET
jgi:Glyoxalase-like domain